MKEMRLCALFFFLSFVAVSCVCVGESDDIVSTNASDTGNRSRYVIFLWTEMSERRTDE